MNWIKELKPGDPVIYEYHVEFANNEYRLAKVEKITPKGYVKVLGVLFDSYGRCRGDHRSMILNPSDPESQQKLQEYQEYNYRIQILHKLHNLNLHELSYKDAQRFNVVLRSMEE